MKKVLLFAAVLFASFSVMNVQAQTTTSDQGEATLTLNLSAVQSIKVDGNVVINYTTANDYANGKAGETATTVTVTSAGGFAVRAEAEDLKDDSYTIASSTIAVKAEGAGNADGATYATDATLEKVGEGKAALITSTQGGVDKKYSVTYEGSGSNEYMKNYNEGGRNYETTVVFTVSAS